MRKLLLLGLVVSGFALSAACVAVPSKLCEVEGCCLVVTTGGTGLSARDVTPEATAAVVQRLVPGIGELLRAASRDRIPAASLSRGIAGVAGRTLIVNLPGSPGAVRDGIAALVPILWHAVDQVSGGDHTAAAAPDSAH